MWTTPVATTASAPRYSADRATIDRVCVADNSAVAVGILWGLAVTGSPLTMGWGNRAQGTKLETARCNVPARWLQIARGAAATTTAVDLGPDTRQAISR